MFSYSSLSLLKTIVLNCQFIYLPLFKVLVSALSLYFFDGVMFSSFLFNFLKFFISDFALHMQSSPTVFIA